MARPRKEGARRAKARVGIPGWAALRGPAAIWALTTATAFAAAVVYAIDLQTVAEGQRESLAVFAVLAVMFAFAEVFVVHLHFRRNAHSFSLVEIPLVVGLFVAGPTALVAAQLVGGGAVLAFHRKQPPIKLAFNLASFALENTLAVLVFVSTCSVLGYSAADAEPLQPMSAQAATWLAATVGALTASATSILLVFVAISLSESTWQLRRLGEPLAFGMASAGVTASLGLIAVIVTEQSLLAGVLLIVPTAGVYLASRAYTSERQRHRSLEFLYQSTRSLHQSTELETAVLDMLRQARDAFRTEVAELYYLPSGSREAFCTLVGPGEATEPLRPAAQEDSAELRRWFSGGGPSISIDRSCGDPGLVGYLERRHLNDALIAPLHGETRLVGLLVLGNRLSDVSRFDDADLRIVETLANHVSMALENGRLERALEQLRELKNQLTYQAYHDPLTNLANRALFVEKVTTVLGGEYATSAPPAVMFVDLDDFKNVNDSLGHAAGDALLVETARRLNACVAEEDMVARLGGDEFAVLIGSAKNRVAPVALARRIIESLSQPVIVGGQSMSVHASAGIATAVGHPDCAELLRSADTAMYVAKANGKQRCELFEPAMHEAALQRYNLKADLQQAVERGEFRVYFQPLIALGASSLVGAEALVRWQHPRLGLLLPETFLTLAEEVGAIVPMGRFVMEEACRWLKDVDEKFPSEPRLSVAVNLAVKDLWEDDLIAELGQLLRTHHIEPDRLVLEITESLMLHDAEAGMRTLQNLKQLGVRLALDDFGTGYSSLNHLRRLPVDIIKIAKPFVDDLHGAEDSTAFVHSIVDLGHILGLQVVAEGIEQADQATLIRGINCELGQGFFFSKPLDAPAFEAWMREWLDSLPHGELAA